MDVFYLILILFGAIGVSCASNASCFPRGFLFGVATAAYQIEGAWNEAGKGESIWDRYTHQHPERVFDHSTGDVADDSYHRYTEDVDLLTRLRVHFYRFSISWPRILPDGLAHNINVDGVKYYRELIASLRSRGIEPVVTMYHWDLPQALQDLGGWTNPIIVDYFVDYGQVLLQLFGGSVRHWITFNEPLSFCGEGYGGMDAPGHNASGFEDYLCAHHVLLAHAALYRVYQRRYQPNQGGQMGITLDIPWMEPNSTSAADREAAERARQFVFGWFAHPIFSKDGDYPAIMRQRVDYMSRRQGYRRSRLPRFTPDQVHMVRGSSDFMGVNHYTTNVVTPGPGRLSKKPSFYDDADVKLMQRDEWPKSNSTWLRIVPWGFRKALNWIREEYGNPVVWVTENGVSLPAGLHDVRRVQYVQSYLRALHDAMQAGSDVRAYTYWSLLDNYEWMRGYSERFGLFEVDYRSAVRRRTARVSAAYFHQLATTGCLPDVSAHYDNTYYHY